MLLVKFQIAIIKNNLMKKIYSLLLFLIGFTTFAQNSTNEQFPVFQECENAIGKQKETCFYNTIQNYFYSNFKVPQELQEQNYKGDRKAHV